MSILWIVGGLAGAALFAVLLCSGSVPQSITASPSSDPLSKFSNDEIRGAALDIVWPVTTPMSGYWGNTLADCDRAKAIVDGKRKKFADYEPARMRGAIMSWLDFEDRRISEARADIVNGTSVRRMQEYDDRQRAKANTTAAVLQTLKNSTR